jgi:hypothetical protein
MAYGRFIERVGVVTSIPVERPESESDSKGGYEGGFGDGFAAGQLAALPSEEDAETAQAMIDAKIAEAREEGIAEGRALQKKEMASVIDAAKTAAPNPKKGKAAKPAATE